MLGGVQRHVNIKVEAQDVNGERIQRTYTDWTARIFQHEYDHLQVCVSRAHHGPCVCSRGLHSDLQGVSSVARATKYPVAVLTAFQSMIMLQGTLFPDRVKKPAKKAIQPFLKELERHWRESA